VRPIPLLVVVAVASGLPSCVTVTGALVGAAPASPVVSSGATGASVVTAGGC
jgi:hypothetical protein